MKDFKELCVAFIALAIVEAVRGLIIAKLWNWFIVPLGVPSIGICLGVGISLLVDTFMLGSGNGKKETELGKVLQAAFQHCGNLLIILGLGAVVRLFV